MKRTPALTDLDPMPFGKFKGKLMQDVPPKYLVWLRESIEKEGVTEQNVKVYNYIMNSWEAIEMELNES